MTVRLARNSTFDLVSIGQASLDTIENDCGTAIDVLGGGGVYVAVIAAVLGARTALVSRVGFDFGDVTINQFRQLGIDLSGFHKVAGKSTRIRLRYRKEYLEELDVSDGVGEDIVVDDMPPHYFSTEFAHIGPAPYATQLLLIEQIKKGGAFVSFAPHDDLKATSVSGIRKILQGVDILFANEFEMLSISREERLDQAIRVLHLAGPSLIVATQGSKGATISRLGETLVIPALEPPKIVDYVGAGDAFAGGFLVGLVRSFPLVVCGILAASAAACIIQEFGLVIPTRARVGEIMNSNYRLLASHGLPTLVLDEFFQEAS